MGRNWYILESAIREHRFGSEEKEPAAQGERSYASSAWDAPRYASEEPSALPPLSDRAGVNALSHASQRQNSAQDEAMNAEPSSLLTDMQAAWQEWYERRETIQEAPEAAVEAIESEFTPEPIALEHVELEEPPAVPTPETTLDLSHTYVNAYEEPERETATQEPEEGIIVEERIRARTGRIGLAITAPVIRSMLIAAMLLSVAVTVVGSGVFEEFAGKSIARSTQIQFLAGVSSYNHQ